MEETPGPMAGVTLMGASVPFACTVKTSRLLVCLFGDRQETCRPALKLMECAAGLVVGGRARGIRDGDEVGLDLDGSPRRCCRRPR